MPQARAPARVLVIDSDVTAALRLQEELAARVGRLVWLWHESSPAHAHTVLSVSQFELIVLEPSADEESLTAAVNELRALAPSVSIALSGDAGPAHDDLVTRLAGIVGFVPRDDAALAADTVLRLLGFKRSSRHQ